MSVCLSVASRNYTETAGRIKRSRKQCHAMMSAGFPGKEGDGRLVRLVLSSACVISAMTSVIRRVFVAVEAAGLEIPAAFPRRESVDRQRQLHVCRDKPSRRDTRHYRADCHRFFSLLWIFMSLLTTELGVPVQKSVLCVCLCVCVYAPSLPLRIAQLMSNMFLFSF